MDIKQTIKRQTLADIEGTATRVAAILSGIRSHMLSPNEKKQAPVLSTVELADLCGVDKKKIAYRLTRGDLPQGTMRGHRREWTMEEALPWIRSFRSHAMRPAGAVREANRRAASSTPTPASWSTAATASKFEML